MFKTKYFVYANCWFLMQLVEVSKYQD